MTAEDAPRAAPSAREKWQAERAFRERELALAEAESKRQSAEFDLRVREQRQSTWRSPLVVAIGAAAFAALGNAGIALVNGNSQRSLEEQKSEQARILEMIKTGDRASAIENLRFLLDAGLIDPQRADRLREYLDSPEARQPNRGPVLPAAGGQTVQRPSDTIRVDLFYCEATPNGRFLAESARELAPSGAAQWRVVALSAQGNADPAYNVNQNEIRFNANEEAFANQLRDLFQRRLEITVVNRPNTMPSEGYLSVFFCEGAVTGSPNEVTDTSEVNAT